MKVYVLGAGFSHAISGNMPLMAGLAQGVYAYLYEHYPRFHERLPKRFLENIEDLLTFLSTDYPWLTASEKLRNKADFLDLSNVIREALKASLQNALHQVQEMDSNSDLMKWISGTTSEQGVAVLSFNYDFIFERLMEKAGYTYEDSYPIAIPMAYTRDGLARFAKEPKPSYIQLVKLHGSLNWVYSGNASFYGEQIYDLGTGYLESRGNPGETREYLRSSADKVSLIVPPTFSKSDFFKNEMVERMWKLAAKNLAEAQEIIFIGYSLPQTDLMFRYLLQSTVFRKPIVRVTVVDPYWEDIVGRLRSLLGPTKDGKPVEYNGIGNFAEFLKAYKQ